MFFYDIFYIDNYVVENPELLVYTFQMFCGKKQWAVCVFMAKTLYLQRRNVPYPTGTAIVSPIFLEGVYFKRLVFDTLKSRKFLHDQRTRQRVDAPLVCNASPFRVCAIFAWGSPRCSFYRVRQCESPKVWNERRSRFPRLC